MLLVGEYLEGKACYIPEVQVMKLIDGCYEIEYL
jgi:hypothetical protein